MTSRLEAVHVANSALPVIDIGGLSSDSAVDGASWGRGRITSVTLAKIAQM